MKVVIDIDGTLTNFSKFIIENKWYIEDKYNIKLTNFNGYDVDEMFELDEKLCKIYKEEYLTKKEEIINDFWNKFYLKYLMSDFRDGVKETLNRLISEGYEVIIASSRKKTCEQSIIGKLVRKSTIYKFKSEKIKYSDIIFFQNDEEKIKYIEEIKPDVLIDDKIKVLNSIYENKNTKCICVSSDYNLYGLKDGVIRKSTFENNEIYKEVEKVRKEKNIHNITVFNYPNLVKTEKNFKLVKALSSPFLKRYYHPIILHKEYLKGTKPIIYAPNHRSTLDPYFITYSSNDAVHWDALKRFFTGEDSIFNNNKNIVLRKITAVLFKELGLIPVNRGGDNLETIELTNYCLQNGSCVGIFPEGTTNKNPEKQELLEIKSGLFHFAKDNNVLIQPISIVWFPKNSKSENKVVINYQKPFSMNGLTIEEGKEKWCESVLNGIEENNEIIKSKILIRK